MPDVLSIIDDISGLLTLPPGAVIHADCGSLEKFSDGHWYQPSLARALPLHRWEQALPARLLWHPEWSPR